MSTSDNGSLEYGYDSSSHEHNTVCLSVDENIFKVRESLEHHCPQREGYIV